MGEPIIVGNDYKSPFRNDGEFGAFRFGYYKDKIFWKDFGGLEMNPAIGTYRDVLGFIMQREGFDNRKDADNFLVQLSDTEVYQNFLLTRKSRKPEIVSLNKKVKDVPIPIVRSYWKQFELEYWNFIDLRLLRKNRIFPCESLKYNGRTSGHDITSTEKSPAFFYFFDSKDSWKLYRPRESKKEKWKSNNIRNVIEGYNSLPRNGENLIITSSTKDRLTIKTYLGIDGINPTNETSWSNIEKKIREINERFKKVYVWLDADKAGRIGTRDICNKTNWTPIYPPLHFKELGLKDQTEMLQNRDPNFLRTFWEEKAKNREYMIEQKLTHHEKFNSPLSVQHLFSKSE